MTERHGDWIQTYTGKQFWPLNPRPEDVDIEDIAHALSNLCRYAGHTTTFYSVAEHSVLLAWAMRRDKQSVDVQRWALMHDTPEAYVVDVPRPLKRFMKEYKIAESRIEGVIAQRFNLPLVIPQIVHDYDLRICNDERTHLMKPCVAEWGDMGQPLGLVPYCFKPADAKIHFLREFKFLFGM